MHMGRLDPPPSFGVRVDQRGQRAGDQQGALDRVARPPGAEHHLDVVAQEAEVVALRLVQLAPGADWLSEARDRRCPGRHPDDTHG